MDQRHLQKPMESFIEGCLGALGRIAGRVFFLLLLAIVAIAGIFLDFIAARLEFLHIRSPNCRLPRPVLQ